MARSNGARYCEKHYYRMRRTGSLTTQFDMQRYEACQHCGRHSSGPKYCDDRCRSRASRGNPPAAACVVCGSSFNPMSDHGPDAKVCSEECGRVRGSAQQRARYLAKMSTEAGRSRYRRNELARKARKAEAFIERVDWLEVMQRSGWSCYLCGGQIDREAKWPAPLFGTVDHVIPLAKGGEHSYRNCKAAHLRCNCSKGDRITTDAR